jgi:hypothetical protein
MTREQIEALTTDELRIECAKAMGWTLMPFCGPGPAPDMWLGSPDGGIGLPPEYSTSMDAAWELVEEMRKPKVEGGYPSDIVLKPSSEHTWRCSWYSLMHEAGSRVTSIGETAPEAICRCFLCWHFGKAGE